LDIKKEKLLEIVENPHLEKYPGQKIFVVDQDGYCILVPLLKPIK
jgi:hypothetical protein